MIQFHVGGMADFVVCSNCGLSYSTNEHESCSHCRFTINDV